VKKVKKSHFRCELWARVDTDFVAFTLQLTWS